MTIAGATIGVGEIARVLVSLGVVFAIMAVAVKVLRSRGIAFGGARALRRPRGDCELVARQGLSRSSSVALVRVGERFLVIGVGDSSVTLLTEGDREAFGLAAMEPERAPEVATSVTEAARTAPQRGLTPASPWKMLLDTMRDRTVRHA